MGLTFIQLFLYLLLEQQQREREREERREKREEGGPDQEKIKTPLDNAFLFLVLLPIEIPPLPVLPVLATLHLKSQTCQGGTHGSKRLVLKALSKK